MFITYSTGKDQPGKVANPARGQLNKENSLSAFAPDNLVSRHGFGRPIPRRACSSPYSGFLPGSAAASIYLFKTAIRHRVSPEFIGARNCIPMAFTVESPPARGQ